jgi:putative SOS response-associated peptidase YedK
MIEEYFSTVSGEDDWTPRYNIAPTQPVLIIRQNLKEPRRELSLVRWGLIPSWAKDMSGAAMMINARAETAATKRACSYEVSPRATWLVQSTTKW